MFVGVELFLNYKIILYITYKYLKCSGIKPKKLVPSNQSSLLSLFMVPHLSNMKNLEFRLSHPTPD